ncbi:hypothetical protein BT93_G2435 [Corymbia citriodora subsp. variegata]|nr:hypothetical protein BT93_G2435 [Corymbia citriodora subsp. variegata]
MNSPSDGRATSTPIPTPTSSPAMATNPQKTGQFLSQQATVARQGVVYPVASSGRGCIPKSPNQLDPTAVRHPVPAASSRALAPSHPKQCFSPSLPLPDCNGCKELRDRAREDAAPVVRDRKVRLSDGDSLYVLCRSWLRNGFPEEPQPQYGVGVKSLPRPLPPVESYRIVKKEAEDDKEDEKDAEELNTHDLLKRHVKHAKRVRSRLRDERLQRIARYKGRLALLLPLQVEQFKSDSAA